MSFVPGRSGTSEGRILVLNRDNLRGDVGSSAGSNTNAVQDITGALGLDSGLWSTPAYWNGNIYMWAENDALKMIPITNGVLAKKATAQSSATSTFPGATPVVPSNGTQNGIVWALITDLYKSNGSAVLYAFNAINVGQQLYASNQNSSRDDPGAAVKFAVPVITNGKVYVGAGRQVDVYGLLNAEQQAPAPVISPSGGTYSGAQQVTMTDTVSGATIYCTTDGSTPTASSTKYTGPITVSSSTAINAIATFSGLTNSNVATASYTIQPSGTEIDYGSGFGGAVGLTFNGSATNVDDTRPQLTTGLTHQSGSALYDTPTNIQAFTTDFAFQLSNGLADGFTPLSDMFRFCGAVPSQQVSIQDEAGEAIRPAGKP
jgi:Chitobiase/beta-hexosaminidase C-terminal domain